MRALLSLVMFTAAFATAQARPEAPAATPAPDFARSERWLLQSPALGEEVAVRIRYPALGIQPTTALLIVMLPAPDVDWIAADLRKRELEGDIYGVVVVSIESIHRQDGKAIASKWSGSADDAPASRFTHFLTEELKPRLEAELPVSDTSLVAGSGHFGTLVLHSAVEARGSFDEFVVAAPEMGAREAGALAARLGDGSDPSSSINVLRSPGQPQALDALLETMSEGPFSIRFDESPGAPPSASEYIRDRAAQMAIVRPW